MHYYYSDKIYILVHVLLTDTKDSPINFVPVQISHRTHGRFDVFVFTESIPFGFSGFTVIHQFQGKDGPGLGENLLQFFLRHFVWNISNYKKINKQLI